MMQHTSTDSSKGSSQCRKQDRQFVVLSLADQKLTLEHNDKLIPFEQGKFH